MAQNSKFVSRQQRQQAQQADQSQEESQTSAAVTESNQVEQGQVEGGAPAETPVQEQTTQAPVQERAQESSNVENVEEVVEQVTAKVAGLQLPITVRKDTMDLMQKIHETNPIDMAHLQRVMEYMVKMAPGNPMNETIGAAAQAELFRALRSILETGGPQWKRILAALLSLIDEFSAPNQVFGEPYVFRFMEYLRLSPSEIKLFKVILNMLSILAPQADRKENSKQFSIARTFGAGLSEEAKSRMLDFLQLQH